MKSEKRRIGDFGEDAACLFLKKKGYRVIDRNYMCKTGEIDVIALSPLKHEIVFVEVKTRSSILYGYPYQFVDSKKRRRIILTALNYVKRFNMGNIQIRFDIIEILNKDNNVYVRHLENVFSFDQG